MQAIDITDMTEKEIEALDNPPSNMDVERPKGKAKPLTLGGSDGVKVVNVRDTEKNRKLIGRFGVKIIDNHGKIDYRKFPTDELLKRMVRRKGDSRENLMEQLGVSFCKKLLDKIPRSDLKLQTKKELKRSIRKCAGMPAEKTSKQKRKEKETKGRTRKPKADRIVGPEEKVDNKD